MVKFIILLIKAYQICLSPLFGGSCKFTPSCSHYMIEAVSKKGCALGVAKGLWRLIRCNPFSKPKYDPVDNA